MNEMMARFLRLHKQKMSEKENVCSLSSVIVFPVLCVLKQLGTLFIWLILFLFALGCPPDIESYRRDLESPQASVRAEAIQKLTETQNQTVRKEIAPFLRDKSPRVRKQAILALGILGCDGYISSLQSRLADEDLAVRLATVRTLGDSGLKAARLPLLNALLDQSLMVRQATRGALEALGLTPAKQTRELAELLLEEQLKGLRSPDEQLRANAALMIGLSGREEGVKPLLQLLRDRSPLVIEQVAVALGRLGGSESEKALLTLSRSKISSDREAAAQGLAKMKSKSSLNALLSLLSDAAQTVRQKAIWGIWQRRGLSGLSKEKVEEKICATLLDVDRKAAFRAALFADREALGCGEQINKLIQDGEKGQYEVAQVLQAFKGEDVTRTLLELAEKGVKEFQFENE